MEDDNKIVEQVNINGVFVSTVFLGLDHGYVRDGRAPVLWETMIFDGQSDGAMWRYCSEADAIANHRMVANRVRKKQLKKTRSVRDQQAFGQWLHRLPAPDIEKFLAPLTV